MALKPLLLSLFSDEYLSLGYVLLISTCALLPLGSPALTSRNLKESDFEKVVDFIDAGVQITIEAQKSSGKL